MKEPLSLPKGSVRALLALGLFLAFVAIAAYLVTQKPDSEMTLLVLGVLVAAFNIAMGFYFGTRAMTAAQPEPLPEAKQPRASP